jgi:hypothetical protein
MASLSTHEFRLTPALAGDRYDPLDTPSAVLVLWFDRFLSIEQIAPRRLAVDVAQAVQSAPNAQRISTASGSERQMTKQPTSSHTG